MKIQQTNSNTNFTSKIRVVSGSRWKKYLPDGAGYVGPPYMAWTMKRGNKLYTDGIATCSAGGFLVEKEGSKERDVIFFHLIPKKHFDMNGCEARSSSIDNIHKKVQKLLEKDKIIQAFLFGGKKQSPNDSRPAFIASLKMFKKLENYVNFILKVPLTKISGLPTKASLAYDGGKDLWLLSANNLEEGKKDVYKYFDKISLAPGDEFI